MAMEQESELNVLRENMPSHLYPQLERIPSTAEPTRSVVKIKQILTLLGGFIVCLSFGSDFSYSNLTTYLISYMRQNGYNDCLGYSSFLYLVVAKMSLQSLSMPWLGGLAIKLGPRWSVLAGSSLYSAGYMLTYYSVQYTFPTACFTLALHGLAFSLVYATAIRTAQAWFSSKRRGLVASIVVSGYGFGSCIWTPLQTIYINPDNMDLTADGDNRACEDSKTKYFQDREILDNVPGMFLMMGIIYAAMGLISVPMIITPSESERPEDLRRSESLKKTSLKPLEMVKTQWFYQTWIGFFSISVAVVLIGTISKAFGLETINDDHFYAHVAIGQNLLNGFSRIAWGFIYDKIGFKKSFTVIGTTVVIFISTLAILLPLLGDTTLGRVFFAVWMCVLYAVSPGIYVIIAAEIAAAFGTEHYQANFGLYYTHYILYIVLIIPIQKSGVGLQAMFLLSAAGAVLGLVAVFVKDICNICINICERYLRYRRAPGQEQS